MKLNKVQIYSNNFDLSFINWLLFLFLFLALISFNTHAGIWGCKAAKVKSGKTVSGCIKVAQQKRDYTIHLPKNHAELNHSMPLIIGLHGGGGNIKHFERYSKLNPAFNQHISVYPKGIKKHWNDGRANVNAGINDAEFLNQLVIHIKNDLALNINKVFIIGMSNGGLMALRMACEQPDWLSGVGIVAATMSDEINAICLSNKKLKPLNIAFIFGDKDTSFLNNGKQVNPIKSTQLRGSHIGINQSLNFWTRNNGCISEPDKTILDADSNDKTKIIKSSYLKCQNPVIYYEVKNGGHRWPHLQSKNGRFLVKKLNLGLASQDMNSAEELLSVLFK